MEAIADAYLVACLRNDWLDDITIYVMVLLRLISEAGKVASRMILWPVLGIHRTISGGDPTLLLEVVDSTIMLGCAFAISALPDKSFLSTALESVFPSWMWIVLFSATGEAKGMTALHGNYLQRSWISAISIVSWVMIAEAISLSPHRRYAYFVFIIPLLIGAIVTTYSLLDRHRANGSTDKHNMG